MRTIHDHPGWRPAGAGHHRTVRTGHDVWRAVDEGPVLTLRRLSTSRDPEPVVDTYTPADLDGPVPAPLRAALEARGPVRRLRTPDLWEALATALMRRTAGVGHAGPVYHRYCDAHGSPVPGSPSAFPGPHTVLALDESHFTELGMAAQRGPLTVAAEAFVASGSAWPDASPPELVDRLREVPGVGAWTARAAVADTTGDFSLYPYGDLRVRTRAAHAVPALDWPVGEAAFARRWRSLTATPAALSALTVLTLALGGG
ncbi:hypothetical protein [Nocardiopsis sp. CNT312]|uniref:hypothetical protein n=1 Tax=Nocardiopsis sp. CNT312 TaxID=1137268 RepID=UPI0004B21903|nr:hypothetical protein [Nocardiopsis sp. CNT312]